jgi:hypothetical protein
MNNNFSIIKSNITKIEKAHRYYFKGEFVMSVEVAERKFKLYVETLDRNIVKSYLCDESDHKKIDKTAHDYSNNLFELDLSNLNDYIEENNYAMLSFDSGVKGNKVWKEFSGFFVYMFNKEIKPMLDNLKI